MNIDKSSSVEFKSFNVVGEQGTEIFKGTALYNGHKISYEFSKKDLGLEETSVYKPEDIKVKIGRLIEENIVKQKKQLISRNDEFSLASIKHKFCSWQPTKYLMTGASFHSNLMRANGSLINPSKENKFTKDCQHLFDRLLELATEGLRTENGEDPSPDEAKEVVLRLGELQSSSFGQMAIKDKKNLKALETFGIQADAFEEPAHDYSSTKGSTARGYYDD